MVVPVCVPSIGEMEQWGSARDLVVNVQDSSILVSKFELQSHFYVHFQTNTLDKGMNSLTPVPVMD